METAVGNYDRTEDREQSRPVDHANISAPTIWVMCTLVLTVLLIRGSAAIHLYMAVPILALNFIGFVVWVQYYRR
jgi:hypothetical protein